jgi:hypothetical protein
MSKLRSIGSTAASATIVAARATSVSFSSQSSDSDMFTLGFP